MKVLIPTSGLGTRLGELTKYTNKSLVKVGDRPVISHIIDSYPDADFVITLGHQGDLVMQFLQLAYPDRNFEFVFVDPYQGKGASLVKSISCAKRHLQCPFILHVADTILYEQLYEVNNNWMGCAVSNRSDLFRTANVTSKTITKINEKGEARYDFVLIGVQGIFDYKDFWATVETLLEGGQDDISDCHVFSNMMSTRNTVIAPRIFGDWSDTGSMNTLEEARLRHPQSQNVLDKNSEAIYFIDDYVIKFFSNMNIAQNRIQRAENLGKLVPTIVDYTDNFYKYEFVKGKLMSRVVTEKNIVDLIDWAEDVLWYETPLADRNGFKELCLGFYRDKTKQRVSDYLYDNKEHDEQSIINGIKVPSCFEILKYVNWDKLCSGKPTKFHGDFILDNILIDDDKFIFLDWRQNFGGNLFWGDKYYDLAKLNHNLIFNHDIVSNGGFTISVKNGTIDCDILRSHHLIECQKALLARLKGLYDMDSINILTYLIWINMAALHQYPLNKFLFNFGKYNLWREVCRQNHV